MREVIVLLLAVTLAACTPATAIREPLSVAPPTPAPLPVVANGAIYQPGVNDRPLFEDRRARRVGDVLTITIAETTSASGKSGMTTENTGSLAITTPAIPGGASGSSSVKSGSKSDASGSNTFSGTLTATVIEVLPNGNLRVAGEKQLHIRHASEFVRFYGVVNPSDITANNSVLSTRVADVKLEYKGVTQLEAADISSMFARIFTTVLPF